MIVLPSEATPIIGPDWTCWEEQTDLKDLRTNSCFIHKITPDESLAEEKKTMDRRSLLQGLLALPIVGVVDGCRHQPYSDDFQSPQGRATTLKVVIDGAFAIVIQTNNRSRVRVFTPKDPDNLHKFYFLDGSERIESKRALEPREANRRYNFELPTDGLRISSQETHIDPKLKSFYATTDLWCQEDYPMTIDLPRPKGISALLPLLPATFKKNHQEACMAIVRVLEYDVTDLSRVKIVWDGGKDLHVTPCASLIKRYEDACQEHERGKTDASDSSQERVTSCPARSKELAAYFAKSDAVFFFGTTVPADLKDLFHPLKFFNEQILASFPRLRDRLELAEIRPREVCRNQATSSHVDATEAEQSTPRFTEVSDMSDCTVSGPLVAFP
jgi:hypothetical protein